MDTPQETSKYNEASFNIFRLHECWLNCRDCRRRGKYDDWKWELDNIWSELIQDVERQHDSNTIKEQNRVHKLRIATAEGRNKLYSALDERELFLRTLQDSVGKGGSYQDGSEDNLE